MQRVASTVHPALARAAARIRVAEIFTSLQGESSLVGWPTVFIRLSGCPLRCSYCDTAYAFHGGRVMPIENVIAHVKECGITHICVTGGEPLAQPGCFALLEALCDDRYLVSLETSGALDISGVDPRVRRIVDIKTPGSGEVQKNYWDNLKVLTASDELKFVLTDRADYEWARHVINDKQIPGESQIFFSPAYQVLSPTDLAEWIITDKLNVRMQLQLHKVLWGDQPGK